MNPTWSDTCRAAPAEVEALRAPKKNYYAQYKHVYRVHLAVILLTYTVTDDVGDALELRTWACGATPGSALRQWKRAHPDVTLTFHTTATSHKAPRYPGQNPLGRRVKVRDYALQNAARGIPIHDHAHNRPKIYELAST